MTAEGSAGSSAGNGPSERVGDHAYGVTRFSETNTRSGGAFFARPSTRREWYLQRPHDPTFRFV